MPAGHPVLAQAPAQVDALAVAFGREVDQSGLGIAQEDVLGGQSFQLGTERRRRLPVRGSGRRPATVGDDLLLHELGLPEQDLPGRPDPIEPLAQVGQERVRLLDGIQELVGHHATPRRSGSSPIEVIRGPGASGKRSRRSSSTGRMPASSAGSTSNSGLSPTYTEASGVTPARRIASSKIRRSGFSIPSTPETTATAKEERRPSRSRSRSSHSSKFETTPSSSPASRSRRRTAGTSSNAR